MTDSFAQRIDAQHWSEAVAAEIRAEMGRQRRTQAELGDYLALAQSAVSRRFTGTVEWYLSEFLRVAEFLHVAPDVLLTRSKDRLNQQLESATA